MQVLVLPREKLVPATHAVMVVPPGHADPGGQLVHCLFLTVVQDKVSYVLAAHVGAQLLHVLAPPSEKLVPVTHPVMVVPPEHAEPGGQVVQTRSDVSVQGLVS